MNWLPKDLVSLILSELPYPQIVILCKSAPYVSICQNDKFWESLLLKDFGITGDHPKDLYMKFYFTTQYDNYHNLLMEFTRVRYQISSLKSKLFKARESKKEQIEDQIDQLEDKKSQIDRRLKSLKKEITKTLKTILPKASYKLVTLNGSQDIIWDNRENLKPGNLVRLENNGTYYFFWDPDVQLTPEYISSNMQNAVIHGDFDYPGYPVNLIDFINDYLHIDKNEPIMSTIEFLYPRLD